ncbi:MAG TPA: DUF4388 domain-containing protein [Myxococcota bacterium]|nr:DUF4388 domain-containing protein [Myxococcota bacterium]HRY95986.1 DUF4388 domain-containing protein [Myxococcota bacterium]HSA22135.1 DUF4388 domain-containing protein [Myxococcota bacterium]
MGLQGTLDSMPVTELMHWFVQRQRTGVLQLKSRGRVKTLHVDQGRVINAASTDPREYFGQFLINLGLIDEDQLQKAFETQQQTKVLLGKILVMTGLLTEEQVLRVLELKIRESILDAFLWDAGAFEFHDGLLPEETSVVHVALELPALVAEGIQRREQHALIRLRIPSNACGFRALDVPASRQVSPTSTAGILLEMARQGLRAEDIILRFHSLDFPVLRTLHELLERGLLEVLAPAAAATELPMLEVELTDVVVEPVEEASPEDAAMAQAEAAMGRRDFEGAVRLLETAAARNAHDPTLATALETAERGLLAALRAELRPERCTPVPQALDRQEPAARWTPAERYLLERVDGRRTLKAILQVSPLRELDALRAVRELVRRGVLGLRG